MGTIAGVSGTCPALSFTLDGKAVKTDAKTMFDQSACADVKNGAKAGAVGTTQTDGSLLALHVRVGDPAK
jgi:hypothetical protein